MHSKAGTKVSLIYCTEPETENNTEKLMLVWHSSNGICRISKPTLYHTQFVQASKQTTSVCYLSGWGADLHMSLPLTVSCSSKSRLVLSSWFYLSGTGSPG